MTKGALVYIMASRYRGGMYVGVTADALARAYQHREGAIVFARTAAKLAKPRVKHGATNLGMAATGSV